MAGAGINCVEQGIFNEITAGSRDVGLMTISREDALARLNVLIKRIKIEAFNWDADVILDPSDNEKLPFSQAILVMTSIIQMSSLEDLTGMATVASGYFSGVFSLLAKRFGFDAEILVQNLSSGLEPINIKLIDLSSAYTAQKTLGEFRADDEVIRVILRQAGKADIVMDTMGQIVLFSSLPDRIKGTLSSLKKLQSFKVSQEANVRADLYMLAAVRAKFKCDEDYPLVSSASRLARNCTVMPHIESYLMPKGGVGSFLCGAPRNAFKYSTAVRQTLMFRDFSEGVAHTVATGDGICVAGAGLPATEDKRPKITRENFKACLTELNAQFPSEELLMFASLPLETISEFQLGMLTVTMLANGSSSDEGHFTIGDGHEKYHGNSNDYINYLLETYLSSPKDKTIEAWSPYVDEMNEESPAMKALHQQMMGLMADHEPEGSPLP